MDTATSCCAGCISVKAECSLFVSKEEWEKVEAEKRQKRLEIARSEALLDAQRAQLSRQKLELLEIEAKERSYANCNHAILNLQDRAQEEAEGSSAPSMDLLAVKPPLLKLLANLG